MISTLTEEFAQAVILILVDPNGNIVSVDQVTPDSSGAYYTTFTASSEGTMKTTGDYEVRAQYGVQKATASFSFTASGYTPPPPGSEPAPGAKKTSEKLSDSAKLVGTPPVVRAFLNNNLVLMNEVTEQELSHYVLLQTVPDVFAERVGIKDQFVTTLAFQDRFGRAESNDNLNVFLQISHTNNQINSMRGIQLGGDGISVIVNDINQGLITMTKEIASEVTCIEGMELILKTSDGSAVCVKSDTIPMLIERGWGIPP